MKQKPLMHVFKLSIFHHDDDDNVTLYINIYIIIDITKKSTFQRTKQDSLRMDFYKNLKLWLDGKVVMFRIVLFYKMLCILYRQGIIRYKQFCNQNIPHYCLYLYHKTRQMVIAIHKTKKG